MDRANIPDDDEIEKNISSLNKKQKDIYDYILKTLDHQEKHNDKTCSCNEVSPLRIFCSGVSGLF